MSNHLKAVVALIGAVAAAVAANVSGDHGVSVTEFIQITIAVANILVVWLAANVPGATAAKTLVALVLAGASAAAGYVGDGFTSSELIEVVIAVLTAAGIYIAPNRGDLTT